MFGAVPYMRRGDVRVAGPEDGRLEGALAALLVERFLGLGPGILGRFLRLYGEVMPEATGAGRRLHRSGDLREMGRERAPVSEVLGRVGEETASAT